MTVRRSSGRLPDLVAAGAAVVTVSGMIATPLLPRRGAGRRALSTVVVAGLFTNTAAHAVRRWGPRRAIAAAGSTIVGTALVERVGTATGLPFGRYSYTDALRPRVGGVPVIVPLAWFAMALPAREAARSIVGETAGRPPRIAVGAAAMTAWDLFLDPQMVGEGYWVWPAGGRYRGIPLRNFAGWFVTAAGVMALLDTVLPRDATLGRDRGADGSLVGTYASMAAMETVAFARYFRDPVVAAVGGAGMLPIAVRAIVRRARG